MDEERRIFLLKLLVAASMVSNGFNLWLIGKLVGDVRSERALSDDRWLVAKKLIEVLQPSSKELKQVFERVDFVKWEQSMPELVGAREKNSSLNEIDHPTSTQGDIMADENTPQTTEATLETSTETATPSRLQSFVNKHPRASKIAAITGGVGTLIGAVCVTRTIQSNRQHLEEAGENAKEALRDLAATVDPATDTEA